MNKDIIHTPLHFADKSECPWKMILFSSYFVLLFYLLYTYLTLLTVLLTMCIWV